MLPHSPDTSSLQSFPSLSSSGLPELLARALAVTDPLSSLHSMRQTKL